MKKNALIIVVAAIILVIAVAIVVAVRFSGQPTANNTAVQNSESQKISDKERAVLVDKGTIVAALPPGLPIEAGVASTTSYKYTPANSADQESVITYVSKKTMEDNMKIFKDYLAASGFSVMNKIETKEFANYLAIKDKNQLSVYISTQNKIVQVSIRYK
jgi:hypothetical protein